MKKLLVIAILMLALVFTIVACDKTPDTTDTTVADTTAETPTEAPSEDADETTEAPTEETPTDPAEETTEAPTEETPTEAPTTAKPEDPTEPPTEEVTTADPADPVWIADPDAIAGVKGANTTAYIADAVVMEEGGYKFVRITVNGGDSQFVVAKDLGTMPKYLAISYRANADKDGEMFIGTANGPNGQNDHNVLAWNQDNSWNLMIVDVSTVANVVDGNVGYFRLDPFKDVTDGYVDIEYIAFFNTVEYAMAYDFELHPPYIEADSADAGKKSHSFDTFYVNGTMYFPQDGGAGDKLTAQNNTLTFGSGDAHDSLGLRGWIGFNQAIDQFGYFVDNYDFIFGEYKQATEDGVLTAGGEFASRFQINVPLNDLTAGTHTIGFVVKLEDGKVIRLRENLTVIIVPFTVDEEIILAARAGGTTPVVAPGQTMGQRYTVNGYLKQISVADMATYSDGNANTWNVKIWAWNTDYATTVAGEPLYSVDGENHNDNQTFNVLVPIEKMITGDIYYEVSYLSGSGGFTGWNAQGKAVDGLETYIGGVFSDVHFASSVIVGVEGDPNEIKMDSHSFQSNAAGNFAEGATADVDLLNSDLANLFAVTYGQGDANHCYVKNNNGAYYWMSAFNSIRTTANGAYVFALDSVYTDNPGFASMIVRANMTANPENQLYGSDGIGDAAASSHGGSGIYVTMDGNNLVINIKSYAGEKQYSSSKFSVPVDSHDIKIADDGSTVYVIAGDKLVATIAISGTKDFGIANVAADALAETVTITLADGTTQTIENAAVASRNNNGALGVATRGAGAITFSALSLMPFDSIEIPQFPVKITLPELPEAGMAFSETLYRGVKTPVTTIHTIEAWLKLDTAARAGVIYGNYSSANPPYNSVSLEIHENGVPRLYYTSADAQNHDIKFTNVHVNTGEWVHLVVTYDATTNLLYCYVNGELAQTVNPTTDAAHKNMTSFDVCDHKPMALGGDYRNGNGQSFKGQLASVTVYSDLRTADEVVADMCAALNAPNTDGLVAAYDLSAYGAGAPEDILDLSGNGYHVTKGADDIIGEPQPEPVENYNVPMNTWTVSGHCPQIVGSTGHGNSPMVAAGGIDQGALLHQGSIGLGNVDLSKYSKVVIKFGVDNSDVTFGHYDQNAENRIMLVNADVNMVMSPAAEQVIAGATYTPQGWALVEIEIDLTGVEYNGPVYVTYDTLPGTFMLFGSVEFVA